MQQSTEQVQKILLVHPHVEMYGSDRSFLQVIQFVRVHWPLCYIRVILTGPGPLADRVRPLVDELVFEDLLILRRSVIKTVLAKIAFGLPLYVARAARHLRWADLAYVNTVVPIDFILASRSVKNRVIIHVREIPRRRDLKLFRALCQWSKAVLIFNSEATKKSFGPINSRAYVVHNAVSGPVNEAVVRAPAAFDTERPLRLAMVGRINDWKGQDLLLDALALLPLEIRKRMSVRIVGGTYLDISEPVERLRRIIHNSNIGNLVRIEGFAPDPSSVYEWCDVCVVPSRLPEPFGRVAIEAMSHGRAVIVADHGGLSEIVVDETMGWRFVPNDTLELANILQHVVENSHDLACRSHAALETYKTKFSEKVLFKRLGSVFENVIEGDHG